eukprot:7871189-Pyramimonas_sp.AAC.1
MPFTIAHGCVRILTEGEDSAHVSAGWYTTPVKEDDRLFILVDMSDHKCQKVCNPRMVEELKRLRALIRPWPPLILWQHMAASRHQPSSPPSRGLASGRSVVVCVQLG